ncbi:cytochrome P450 [Byssothecium circinans]|uniref:Cytochrome P450 n=1 Tax=Byssothecium circinans TaxID=147558 RepID=A0A6A5TK74_9PLEO|nr:cytochrome P450 [Byssothecium circinans]
MDSLSLDLSSLSLLANVIELWALPYIFILSVLLLFLKAYFATKVIEGAPYLPCAKGFNGLPKDFNNYIGTGYNKVNFPADYYFNSAKVPQFRETMFSTPTDSGPLVILPQKFVDEVKSLPESVSSFRKSFEFVSNEHQLALIHAAKHHLTRNKDLEKLLDGLQIELDFAFEEELPACEDWKDTKIYPLVIRIVARLIVRVMVGPELCRNEEYLRMSIDFTVNCLLVSRFLAWCPIPLRPIVKYFTPGYQALRRQERLAERLLGPILHQRLQCQHNSTAEKPCDMLQWLIDARPEGSVCDARYLAIAQLNASLAAIHSTAIVVTNAIFDLASRPAYFEPLRTELQSLMQGTSNAKMNNINILELKKLDSFLKESQRLNPLGLIGLMRSAVSDIHLSDGSMLPKGTQFAFAMRNMSYDDTVFEKASTFDGFRFESMHERSQDKSTQRWQFVATNNSSYSFGHGRHACPGRFFAALEMKLILANLIQRYDFKTVGEKIEYRTGVRGFMLVPDPEQVISIKKRLV